MTARPPLGKRFFAWIMKTGESTNRKLYGSIKASLLRQVHGRVLEIGPGTGINFNYLPKDIEWIGIEPNTAFHGMLLSQAHEYAINARIMAGNAAHIPLPDDHVDVVIFTLVLCSVPDPAAAIHEMKRVLRPGGKLIFIEHVAAPAGSTLRKVQDFCNPVNRILADGCSCNRETWHYFEAAGFSQLTLKHVRLKSLLIHAPHIIGTATK